MRARGLHSGILNVSLSMNGEVGVSGMSMKNCEWQIDHDAVA